MTPGTHNLVIYRGAQFALRLTFTDTDTEAALDLTGLSPFIAQIRQRAKAPLILELTVTDTDLANGVIEISATAAQTAPVQPGDYEWGLRDAQDNPYLEGKVTFKRFIPQP